MVLPIPLHWTPYCTEILLYAVQRFYCMQHRDGTVHCTVGCFSKDTLKKIKCTTHHITFEYLERSYPEGEADQTSLGGPH